MTKNYHMFRSSRGQILRKEMGGKTVTHDMGSSLTNDLMALEGRSQDELSVAGEHAKKTPTLADKIAAWDQEISKSEETIGNARFRLNRIVQKLKNRRRGHASDRRARRRVMFADRFVQRPPYKVGWPVSRSKLLLATEVAANISVRIDSNVNSLKLSGVPDLNARDDDPPPFVRRGPGRKCKNIPRYSF